MRGLLLGIIAKSGFAPAAIAAVIGAAGVAPAQTEVPEDAPPITRGRASDERHAGDPLALRALDPNFDTFPDSSLADFSFLLDAPAGKHGPVVAAPDGSFRLRDTNEEIRFWGVTVAASHVDIGKDKIRTAVDVLARAGCNLLRLHELDNRGGEQYNLLRRSIIDESYPYNQVSTEFDPEYRDRVDYWIAEAQTRGMYVYLVLRAYRTFREGDGVPEAARLPRAAKPYAFFNRRLIDLQKQYAEEWLLKHVNPYTGQPNGTNPAIAMIEIENEDSLFFNAGNWNNLVEPYRTELQTLWVEWLREQYGTDEKLREAWTDWLGVCALTDGESLANGIALPDLSRPQQPNGMRKTVSEPGRMHTERTRDGVRFGAEIQRRYFTEMRDFLRDLGITVPQTAVVNTDIIVDSWTVAESLDMAGQNAYLDHPAFMPGATWVGRSFFSMANVVARRDPWSMPAQLARYTWGGKPMVCREWNTSWPNPHRGAAVLDIAAQGCVQAQDAFIQFAYYTWGNPDLISTFGFQGDPVRWGVFGYAGLLFQQGHLKAPDETVRIIHTTTDLADWGGYLGPLQTLALSERVELWNPDLGKLGALPGEPHASVVAARSGRGTPWTMTRCVLWDAKFADHVEMGDAKRPEDALLTAAGYDHPWVYRGERFPVWALEKDGFWPMFRLEHTDLQVRGFYDPERENLALAGATESEVLRAAKGLARFLRDPVRTRERLQELLDEEPTAAPSWEGFRRDFEAGRIVIDTPAFAAVGGGLAGGKVEAGELTIESISTTGTVTAASLDGKPLRESERFAVKMTTIARNRGEEVTTHTERRAPGAYVVAFPGAPPVQTGGRPVDEAPSRVNIAGRLAVDVWMEDGTWEVLVDAKRGEVLLACDTPNVTFAVSAPGVFEPADGDAVSVEQHFVSHPPRALQQTGQRVIYPGFSKYVRLTMAAD